MKQERLSTGQLTTIIAIAVMGTLVLSLPRTLAGGAENSAWISQLIGWAIGAAGMVLFVRLAERFPTKTLTEYSAIVFGRWFGKLASLSFSAYLIALSALYTRVFAQSIVISLLPETPISVVLAVFAVLLVYESHAGLRSIAQLSQIFIIPIVLPALLIVLGVVPLVDLGRLQPLGEPGLVPIFTTALMSSTYAGESVVILMLYPYLTRKAGALRSGLLGLGIALLLLLPVVVAGIGVFGHERITDLLFPTLSLARLISFGGVIEHAEVLFVVLWLFSAFLKVSIFFYAGSVALAQSLDIDDYRPLVNILAIIVVFGSVLPDNVAVILELRSLVDRFGWIYQYGIALLVFVVALVLRKGDQSE